MDIEVVPQGMQPTEAVVIPQGELDSLVNDIFNEGEQNEESVEESESNDELNEEEIEESNEEDSLEDIDIDNDDSDDNEINEDKVEKKESPKDKLSKIEKELEDLKIQHELKVKESEKQLKLAVKRIKNLQEIEQKYNAILGQGYEESQKVIQHLKNKDLGGVLKEFGIKADDIIDYYNGYIKDPEKVKEEVARQEKAKLIEEREKAQRQLQYTNLNIQASQYIAKFEEKLPFISSLGEKGANQIVDTALQLRRENSPLIKDCKTFHEVLMKLLPRVEKQLKTELSPLIEKVQSKSKPQEEKKVDKGEPKKEEKVQEKVKSKPVKPKMEQNERRAEKSSSVKDGKLIGNDEDQTRREQEAVRMAKRMFL